MFDEVERARPSSRSGSAESAPVSVLVVDDHPVVTMGVSLMLAAEPGLKLVGEASSCAEAWQRLREFNPDVVLGDLLLDDGTACDLLEMMATEGFGAKVLVYTAHTSEAHVLDALRAGASGYVIKGSTPERLIDAIYTVADGDSYLDPAIASQVMGRVGRKKERRSGNSRELTEREMTVLHGVASGKSNKEIASELFISERTVKYHTKGLFAKLRVKNRTQAVRAAVEQGLIQL